MNKNTKQLTQLNQDFYTSISQEFNKTRQYFWQGWFDLLPFLRKYFDSQKDLKVLDIACGNARLAEFLKLETDFNFTYLGLDSNTDLLHKANLKFRQDPNIKVLQKDVLKSEILLSDRFDLITAFGIIHHLPADLSLDFFTNLKKLTKPQSLLVFSVWDFAQFESVKKKIITDSTQLQKIYRKYYLDVAKLNSNDYFLAWNKGVRAVRYCHYYSHLDILEILEKAGLKFIKSYQADGKEGRVNRYYLAFITNPY